MQIPNNFQTNTNRLSIDEENQEPVSGHPKLFPLPLAMMKEYMMNDNITDKKC